MKLFYVLSVDQNQPLWPMKLGNFNIALKLVKFLNLVFFLIASRRSSGVSTTLSVTGCIVHAFEQFNRSRRHNGGIDPSQQNSSHLHGRALRSPSPTG